MNNINQGEIIRWRKKKLNVKIIIPIVVVIIVAIVGMVIAVNNGNVSTLGKKELNVGETAKSGNWEFILTNIQYGEVLCNMSARENFLLAGDYEKSNIAYNPNWKPLDSDSEQFMTVNNPYVAEDGYYLVPICFNVKYLGKDKKSYTPNIILDYDNGYTFDYKEDKSLNSYFHINSSNSDYYWEHKTNYEFEPLTKNEVEFRTYFNVPKVVMDDIDKPLKIIVKLSGKTFEYKIR